MVTRRFFVGIALLLTFSATASQGFADDCAPCAPAAAACQTCQPAPQYVQKTVMCPVMVNETRTCTVTQCRPEVRQRTVMVTQRIREVTPVQRQYTTMVPEMRTRTEQYMVCRPVTRQETRTVTEMVPTVETRQGTRTVCKMMPVTQKRSVCEDQGHWEERDLGQSVQLLRAVRGGVQAPLLGSKNGAKRSRGHVYEVGRRRGTVQLPGNRLQAGAANMHGQHLLLGTSARDATGLLQSVRPEDVREDRIRDHVPLRVGPQGPVLHGHGSLSGAKAGHGPSLQDGARRRSCVPVCASCCATKCKTRCCR